MDASPFGRYTIAGWVFAAVFIAAQADTNSPLWQSLTVGFTNPNAGGLAAAVLPAIVGLTGPPALGFVLTTVVGSLWDVVALFRRSHRIRVAESTDVFVRTAMEGLHARDATIPQLRERVVKRVYFYSLADQRLLNWWQGESAQTYAAFSSALGIVAAWLISAVFSPFAWRVFFVSLPIALALALASLEENRRRQETREAWFPTLGVVAVRQLRPSGVADQP